MICSVRTSLHFWQCGAYEMKSICDCERALTSESDSRRVYVYRDHMMFLAFVCTVRGNDIPKLVSGDNDGRMRLSMRQMKTVH